MNTLFRLALIGLAFAIPGCNSGGGEPTRLPTTPPPTSPSPPPPPDLAWVSCADQPAAAEPSLVAPQASPGGIWSGTLTNETRQTTRHFEALIGEDGRFHFRTYGDSADLVTPQFAGRLETLGNTLAGTGRAYFAKGDAAFESRYSGDVEMTGVTIERERFTAQWTAATGDTGCIDASSYYSYDYEQPSSAGVPARTWTAYLEPTLVLTIDADGRFSGQGGDGCTVDGRMAPVDQRYGLFEVALGISGCATAGDYAGLAYLCWTCGMGGIGEPYLLVYFDNGVRALHRFFY